MYLDNGRAERGGRKFGACLLQRRDRRLCQALPVLAVQALRRSFVAARARRRKSGLQGGHRRGRDIVQNDDVSGGCMGEGHGAGAARHEPGGRQGRAECRPTSWWCPRQGRRAPNPRCRRPPDLRPPAHPLRRPPLRGPPQRRCRPGCSGARWHRSRCQRPSSLRPTSRTLCRPRRTAPAVAGTSPALGAACEHGGRGWRAAVVRAHPFGSRSPKVRVTYRSAQARSS